MKLNQVKLGSQGLIIPNIGLGCMGMTGFGDANMYGPADEQEAIATIHRSLELGGNFLDTADLYGPFKTSSLLQKQLKAIGTSISSPPNLVGKSMTTNRLPGKSTEVKTMLKIC